jgi:hypothetical protein
VVEALGGILHCCILRARGVARTVFGKTVCEEGGVVVRGRW